MALNRYLAPGPEGALSFRRGRRYRLVVVVNGPCDVEDLEATLGGYGFAEIASSPPADWAGDKPSDWPVEALPRIAANECPVRLSALFVDDEPITFERDWTIGETQATATIVQAWDYGAASPAQVTGAAKPGEPGKSPLPYVGVAVAALGGLALFNHWSSQRRQEREQKRLASAEEQAERAEVYAKAQALVDGGLTEREAIERIERDEARERAAEQSAQVVYIVPT